MDSSMQGGGTATAAGINKSSAGGIPRLSKLPQIQPRASQLPGPKKPLEKPSIPSLKAPTTKTPLIQKRSSIAALPRPTSALQRTSVPASRVTQPKVPTSRIGSHGRKVSAGPKPSLARPASQTSSIRSFSSTARSSAALDDAEYHDQLRSLDTFRSASRQGFEDENVLEQPSGRSIPAPARPRKTSRPSLSDRTIESLQNVPATPKDRRQSNFFSPGESPMGPPSRPISRASRSGSISDGRPGTSHGAFAVPALPPLSSMKKAPASAKPASRISTGGFGFAPSVVKGRSISGVATSKVQPSPVPASPRTPVPSKRQPALGLQSAKQPVSGVPSSIRAPRGLTGSKTAAVRPSKSRPSLTNTFGSASNLRTPSHSPVSTAQDHSPPTTAVKTTTRAVSNPSAASLALRQQIAAAKAAARKEKARHDSAQNSVSSARDEYDVESHADPFNQAPKDEKHILRNRINHARMDGKLNIAALQLEQIPDEVIGMYDAAAMTEGNINWAEVVDLTRLIAADNKLKELGESMFPDKTQEEFEADEQNHQFGGLESIDVHGNLLLAIPLGFRRLERLTVLNLAHNKLDMSVFDVVAQIKSLKDLKLGHNALSGSLPATLCQLEHLESLDLQTNRLQALPEALRELVSLKVLNVSGNQLTVLPMEAFQELNLTELDASSNALIGPLFPLGGTTGHPTIQTLMVANNALAALAFSDMLEFPRLRVLDVTNNHITVLPNLSGWKELVTLTAGDNKIAEIPAGFTSLRKLKNANFTSNDLRILDPQIGKMENLEYLIVASNPLREKKFLTMSAHDIKRDLKTRLDPDPDERVTTLEAGLHPSGPSTPLASSPTHSWTLKANGTLDLSSKELSEDINDSLGSFLTRHEVKDLRLQMNKLTAVPPALWLGQDIRILDLSGNALGSEYLSDELALPALQELTLTRCSITTLDPLLTQLRAPNLHTLNISANRLTGPLPLLRASYPALRTFYAADNGFTAITADTLRGLHAVNLSSNNLDRLPPEIGLLWDEGLHSLAIGSNAFRVPNYRILEKGTEATLRWLRDRLPAATIADAGQE